MNGEIHIGDNIHQSGPGSIGKIFNHGPVDPQTALHDMIALAIDLRAQVSATDREVIDESVETVRQGKGAERYALRRALETLTGIATTAGTVGGPVLDAALKVKKLFGL